MSNTPYDGSINMKDISKLLLVRGTGFEPASPCGRHHLKVMRLPVSPPARILNFKLLPNLLAGELADEIELGAMDLFRRRKYLHF